MTKEQKEYLTKVREEEKTYSSIIKELKKKTTKSNQKLLLDKVAQMPDPSNFYFKLATRNYLPLRLLSEVENLDVEYLETKLRENGKLKDSETLLDAKKAATRKFIEVYGKDDLLMHAKNYSTICKINFGDSNIYNSKKVLEIFERVLVEQVKQGNRPINDILEYAVNVPNANKIILGNEMAKLVEYDGEYYNKLKDYMPYDKNFIQFVITKVDAIHNNLINKDNLITFNKIR